MSKYEPDSVEAMPARGPDDPRKADDRTPEPIDPAHRAAIEAALADMRTGRLAPAADIEAMYARFGRGAR